MAHDEDVLYILASSPVEGTAYASQVLGIPLRAQRAQARLICSINVIPEQFNEGDRIKPSPEFERLLKPTEGWNVPLDWSRTQFRTSQVDRATAARIATMVRRRGGTILPAYDVPDELTPEAIERWLAQEG